MIALTIDGRVVRRIEYADGSVEEFADFRPVPMNDAKGVADLLRRVGKRAEARQ